MTDPDMEKARAIALSGFRNAGLWATANITEGDIVPMTEVIAAAIKAEREACVMVCENLRRIYMSEEYSYPAGSAVIENIVCSNVIDAIRARGGE